jgi:hypothetical protein
VTQAVVSVSVSADGQTATIQLPAGSTVSDALNETDIAISTLDRTNPPDYTVLSDGDTIAIVRVTEEFTIEEIVLPFENQVVRNESLPDGETRLVQPGLNGLQEITYRRVFEDGIEVSVNPVKSVILQEAVAEIVMIGSQTPFAPVEFPGQIAYFSGGNAWIMDGNSGNRRPVVTTGDLDGQILRLSPDGEWLLFTRRSESEDVINTLWAGRISTSEEQLIDLDAQNIIHFADWVPTSVLRVAYSTVEPRSTAPGWQANNDLIMVSFSTSGWVGNRSTFLESNSGGIYGWWGTQFAWSPDGLRLAYARPDGVGILDIQEDDEEVLNTPILAITPLQTQSDWAWVPGLTWSPSGDALYTVNHPVAEGATDLEGSPNFDLTALSLAGAPPIAVIPQSGMFTYPSASPLQTLPSGEQAYQIAYLQAIFPSQSQESRYRLVVMDRDGSDQRVLFPEQGAPGIEPLPLIWAPVPHGSAWQYWIGLIYQGNIWLIDSLTGEAFQLTGDGQVDRIDWR